jgi:hypothetical protein
MVITSLALEGEREGGLGIAHITKIFISTTKNKGREAKSNIIFVIMQKREKMNSLVYFRSSHNLLFWHPLFCCIKISHSISLFQSRRKRNPCTLSLHHHKSTKVAILFNWLAAAALRQGDHGPIRW